MDLMISIGLSICVYIIAFHEKFLLAVVNSGNFD